MSYNRLGIGLGTGFPVGPLDVLNKLVVLESGNVGIGVTNPEYPLDVRGTGSVQANVGSTVASQPGQLTVRNHALDNTVQIHTKWTGGTPTARIIASGPGGATQDFMVNGNTTFTASGFVGIGTTTPNVPLHTEGKVFINDTTGVTNGQGTTMVIRNQQTNASIFQIQGTGISTVADFSSNGNVGIGTGTSSSRLTVDGDISFTGNLFQNGIPFSSGGGGEALPLGGIVRYPWSAPLPSGFLKCDGSEVSKTTYDLLFGILGTSYGTPVDPNNFVLPYFFDYVVKYSASGASIDYMPIGTIITLSWNVTPEPQGYLKCDGSDVSRSTYNQLFNAIGTGYGSGDGSTTFTLPLFFNQWIKYQTTVVTGDITPWTTVPGNEVYTLGNVGIGTTDPTHRLDVAGSVALRDGISIFDTTPVSLVNYEAGRIETIPAETDAGTKMVFKTGSGGYTNMTMVGGNVGIGTVTPQRALHVNGNTRLGTVDITYGGSAGDRTSRLFFNEDDGNFGNLGFSLSYNGGGAGEIDGLNTNQFGICSVEAGAFTPRLVVNRGNGRVGIGVTNPEDDLHVEGTAKFKDTVKSSKVLAPISGWTSAVQLDTKILFYDNGGVNWSGMGVDSAGVWWLRTGTTAPNYMVMNESGRVGIGVTNPQAILHVQGSAPDTFNWNSYYDYFGQFNAGEWDPQDPNYGISIYATHAVVAEMFGVVSDARIKKDLQQINDGAALSKLRLIEPTEYNYIDHVTKTNKRIFGFIAQQVREHFPEATKLTRGFVPDIYGIFSMDVQVQRLTIPGKAKAGKLRLIAKSRQLDVEVAAPSPDVVQLPEGTLTESDIQDGKVFVYGYEVEDFHTLNKDYLFTINFAATQELDRKVQTLESRNEALTSRGEVLETENQSLKTEVSGLRSELQALRDVLREKGLIE